MPRELLAPHGAGKQQMQLHGMMSYGGVSTAVGPADLLEVQVVTGLAGEEAEAIQVRVGDNGLVDIPFVGPVAVAGLEPTAASQQIAAAAVERGVYLRPQVSVLVAEQATNRITVLGAVAEPGTHEVPRTACDLLTAIAAAGGFTEESGTVVELLRHGQPNFAETETATTEGGVQQASFNGPPPPGGHPARTEQINLSDIASTSATQQRLGDRDVIVVRPREKRVIHVSGLVHKPDQFELTEDHDLRMLDAIAMAGGITTSVADKVLVIRQQPGRSEPVVVEVSLSQAKSNGAENLLLRSGDLVSVESTVATTVVETFKDLFRISMGVGGNLSLF